MNEYVSLCHALQTIFRTSLGSLHRLLKILKTPEAIWQCSEQKIACVLKERNACKNFIAARRSFDCEKEWNTLHHTLQSVQGFVITQHDDAYPLLLREIPQPPLMLYGRGNKKLLNAMPLMAVVGSRRATSYGKAAIKNIIRDCINHNMTIVSGLAFGIDRMAHEETLCHDGKTIAVVGSSIMDEKLYPRSHVALAHRIIATQGLLISEYPPETRARPHFFPERNRIIAGLSEGVIIVEACERSGSLITARLALETNRDVYAVPGPITSQQSRGTNKLLMHGAIPWLSCASMTNGIECSHTLKSQNYVVVLSPEEQKLYTLLTHEPITADELIAKSNMVASQALAILSTLELRGLIAKKDGIRYHIH